MSFHMCPIEPRALELFADGWPSKQRIPIAERARLARQNKMVSFDAAKAILPQAKFELGGNEFYVNALRTIRENDITPHLISKLGSAFFGARVEMLITNFSGRYDAKIEAKKRDTLASVANLSINVRCESKTIYISSLDSYLSGHGGRLLTGIYNLAGDIGFDLITYWVFLHNINARQMYFYMDFGKPIAERSGDGERVEVWNVKVE